MWARDLGRRWWMAYSTVLYVLYCTFLYQKYYKQRNANERQFDRFLLQGPFNTRLGRPLESPVCPFWTLLTIVAFFFSLLWWPSTHQSASRPSKVPYFCYFMNCVVTTFIHHRAPRWRCFSFLLPTINICHFNCLADRALYPVVDGGAIYQFNRGID